jgi:NTE family protein
VEALAKTYQRRLIRTSLTRLPARPKFVFCATDMAFGVNWVFDSGSFDPSRRRVGDYLAGYLKQFPDWPVAKAVAASSCFPPVFNPMRLHLAPGDLQRPRNARKEWADLIAHISLSDGGVYDNMGFEPTWKRARTVLVSDGGAVFRAKRDRGLLQRINRYTEIAGRQGSALRKRWLISNFLRGEMDGAYWGLGSAADHYPRVADTFYPEDLVDQVISELRTDLDAFSEAEQAVLENHGYLLADAAARSHLSEMIEPGSPEAKPPYEEWLDEDRVRVALADSHKRKALGRW